MKELLNELLSHILIEAKATRNNQYGVPNGLYHRGKGRYYDSETGGEYKGSVIDKKWYPVGTEPKIDKTLAQREKDAAASRKTKGRGADYIGGVDPKTLQKKIEPKTSVGDTEDDLASLVAIPSVDSGDTIQSKKTEVVNDIITTLKKALKKGDTKAVQELVEKYKLRVGKGAPHVLKTATVTSVKGNPNRNPQDITNGNTELSDKLVKALIRSGAVVPGAERIGKRGEQNKSEEFKPSTAYSDRPILETSTTSNSVTIGGATYTMLTAFPPGSNARRQLMVERGNVSEILKRDPTLKPDEVERKADDINGIVETHNARVRFLQEAIQKGDEFIDLGSGKDAVDVVADRLIELLGKEIPEEFSEEFASEIDSLRNVKTVDEFETLWAEFNETLNKSNLPEGSIPLICEHLAAMYHALGGANITIPMSGTFKLGDIIARSPDGVSTKTPRSIIDGIQLVEVSLNVGSVKRDTGAAAVVGSRTHASTYSGQGVAEDLDVLGRSPTKDGTDPGTIGEIYNANTKNELDNVEKKLVGVVRKRIKNIRQYYKIPDNVSDNQIIEGLKNGNPPRYDKKGNFIGFGEPHSMFSGTDPDGNTVSNINTRQLALYSLCGFAYDGIYNTMCTGQAYSNTSFKPNSISVSDGLRIMGQSKFQFSKQMRWRKIKGTDRYVLRDDGIAAQIKPVPRKQLGVYKS